MEKRDSKFEPKSNQNYEISPLFSVIKSEDYNL